MDACQETESAVGLGLPKEGERLLRHVDIDVLQEAGDYRERNAMCNEHTHKRPQESQEGLGQGSRWFTGLRRDT